MLLLLNSPIVAYLKIKHCLFYLFICNVCLCSNFFSKIFIFSHFCLNICHTFYIYIFCYLKRLCLYNRAISLAVMLKQLANRKTNMTKTLDKTVNRDTPSRGKPRRPTIVPSQRHFAPAPPEACARHWGELPSKFTTSEKPYIWSRWCKCQNVLGKCVLCS